MKPAAMVSCTLGRQGKNPCEMESGTGRAGVVNYELRITNYELRITSELGT